MKRTIAEEAARLLAGLGDTPDEIAATLRGAGYRGVRGNPWRCPCGSCLADHLGRRGQKLRVTHESVLGSVWDKGDGAPIAPQVREFVRYFDGGKYPDLDAEAKP